jgi:hypothetical protein
VAGTMCEPAINTSGEFGKPARIQSMPVRTSRSPGDTGRAPRHAWATTLENLELRGYATATVRATRLPVGL